MAVTFDEARNRGLARKIYPFRLSTDVGCYLIVAPDGCNAIADDCDGRRVRVIVVHRKYVALRQLQVCDEVRSRRAGRFLACGLCD